MKNLILVAKKKKTWKPSSGNITRALTIPSSLMLPYPEIKDTLYDVFYNQETGELIFRPCKDTSINAE